MDKAFLYGIIGGLVGVIVGILFTGNVVNNRNYGMMNMMGMRIRQDDSFSYPTQKDEIEKEGMDMSMRQMSSLLATLEGDEFDKEFLVRMTDHHQGAIDMAELVLEKSKRSELKGLANDIITTQTGEIEMMEKWMESWFGK